MKTFSVTLFLAALVAGAQVSQDKGNGVGSHLDNQILNEASKNIDTTKKEDERNPIPVNVDEGTGKSSKSTTDGDDLKSNSFDSDDTKTSTASVIKEPYDYKKPYIPYQPYTEDTDRSFIDEVGSNKATAPIIKDPYNDEVIAPVAKDPYVDGVIVPGTVNDLAKKAATPIISKEKIIELKEPVTNTDPFTNKRVIDEVVVPDVNKPEVKDVLTPVINDPYTNEVVTPISKGSTIDKKFESIEEPSTDKVVDRAVKDPYTTEIVTPVVNDPYTNENITPVSKSTRSGGLDTTVPQDSVDVERTATSNDEVTTDSTTSNLESSYETEVPPSTLEVPRSTRRPYYSDVDGFNDSRRPRYEDVDRVYDSRRPYRSDVDGFSDSRRPYRGDVDRFYNSRRPFYDDDLEGSYRNRRPASYYDRYNGRYPYYEDANTPYRVDPYPNSRYPPRRPRYEDNSASYDARALYYDNDQNYHVTNSYGHHDNYSPINQNYNHQKAVNYLPYSNIVVVDKHDYNRGDRYYGRKRRTGHQMRRKCNSYRYRNTRGCRKYRRRLAAARRHD